MCVGGNMMSMEQWCVCVWEHDVNGAMVCVGTCCQGSNGVCVCGNMMSMVCVCVGT